MPSRREFMLGAAGLVVSGFSARQLAAVPTERITVYKSQSCKCCALWVKHLEASGFAVQVFNEEAMDGLKDSLGVPQAVRSCHTALAGKYLIEGHVPAQDIRRLLAEKPKVLGLAVPGMPPGTPGMAQSESEAGGYTVLGFQSDGTTRTFSQH
jgi:hypothetical protein